MSDWCHNGCSIGQYFLSTPNKNNSDYFTAYVFSFVCRKCTPMVLKCIVFTSFTSQTEYGAIIITQYWEW